MINSVTQMAKDDIFEYLSNKQKVTGFGIHKEVWDICCQHIFTTESKLKNKELGISGINKIGNTNNKYI